MPIVRINGKTINTVNDKKVRAIHYGDKTWLVDEDIDFTYTIENNEVTITGYTGSDTEVVIPSTINGYSVTNIGYRAFSGNTNLTSITLPNTLTSIDDEAFQGCSALTNITIPNGVKNIGNYAFNNCFSLNGLEIPASVTSIGNQALTLKNIIEGVTLTFTFKGSIPPTIGQRVFFSSSNVFIYGTLIIIVPTGYGDIYKEWDDNWSNWADYIVEE